MSIQVGNMIDPVLWQQIPRGKEAVQGIRLRSSGIAKKNGSDVPEHKKPADDSLLHSQHNGVSAEQTNPIHNKKFKLTVNRQAQEIGVKVIERETDKSIKDLPFKESLQSNNGMKGAIGFFFDTQV